jgi:hypothetical protein
MWKVRRWPMKGRAQIGLTLLDPLQEQRVQQMAAIAADSAIAAKAVGPWKF